ALGALGRHAGLARRAGARRRRARGSPRRGGDLGFQRGAHAAPAAGRGTSMKRWQGRVGAERLRRFVVAGGAAALVLVGAGAADATDGGSAAPVPQCSDGLDNDGDGWIDHYEDPDCAGAEDDDEGPPAEGAALLGGGDTL